MKTTFTATIITLLTLWAAAANAANTIDFEDVTPRDPALADLYWVGNTGFTSGGATFYGEDYGGFVASDSTNLSGWGYFFLGDSTATSEISAYVPPSGGGFGPSNNFAVASRSYGQDAYINLPAGTSPASVRVTNTTTAYFSMLNGDPFGAKKFGGTSGNDPDYFSVTLTGYDAANAGGSSTDSVTFYLADYRFSNNALDYIVSDWTLVDLTSLGNAASISLSWASSDESFGWINTPTYVALDNLVTTPEPASIALLAIGASTLIARRRRVA
ncbi:MAG: DUF4465 domain-containing protein [Phycisphaeraceae bacterium]